MVLERTYVAWENRIREELMSSTGRSHRSRYRFGFKGKRPIRDPQVATTDEILDSLTRQAKLIDADSKERTLELQTLTGVELNEDNSEFSNLEPTRTLRHLKTRRLGMYVFGAMLTMGLTLLWIYTRLSRILDFNTLSILQTISRTGFADVQKILVIAFCAVGMALLARRSRRSVHARSLSTVSVS